MDELAKAKKVIADHKKKQKELKAIEDKLKKDQIERDCATVPFTINDLLAYHNETGYNIAIFQEGVAEELLTWKRKQ